MSDELQPNSKKRRISRACDYCHRASKRCRVVLDESRCQNCIAFDQPCTFDRPQKRRGAPPHKDTGPPVHHRHAVIMDFVELFFEIVYPIFPLFHQPSFIRRISRTEYLTDRALYVVTMAVCSLVSARVRDGAVFSAGWDLPSLQEPPPHVYHDEAIRNLDADSAAGCLNTLRSHAILALFSIQEGRVRDMHEHLGRYHTIVAVGGLHDELNWPKTAGIIEREERRRLFWSMYTLDIFTSIVWGGVIRSREYQSSVSYPTEADDDMFDDSGFASIVNSNGGASTSPGALHTDSGAISWIAGRNIVVDLYRVLEHIMMRLCARNSRAQRQTLLDTVLQISDSLSQESVLGSVMQWHADLPQCFKNTNPITCKPRLDRFGFQAADAIATVQLVRMVLLSATGAGVPEKCQIANEVIKAFIAIPTAYHHAISVPLLFHLGVIGQMLATTLGQTLSENDYSNIRGVMMAMVRLLSSLEGLHASKGASQRLLDQIARIDEYMTLQRHRTSRRQQIRPEAPEIVPRTEPDTRYATLMSSYGTQSIDDPTDLSPFQLPSEILGDLDNIFDFSQMP
ncbi:hypothetical protein DOTSEDRAFT_88987 [Dothistroma septosporum NZE10]|uniref:Zn(2)-C6 fungal-type domain-containing protein n=1 Tax=Dothistroma septosporum (strain NZE10 / CBS 128990) TaxID=675120 RepID=M2Y3X7_DOTSN|nr:hypothetical protein DOTSEDRAFT_88987 [Dothistroma septosporum NZE10]